MKKIIRITTVPISLKLLLKGQLRYMAHDFEVVGLTSFGEELDEIRTEEGIRVEVIEMTRQITPLKDLIALWKIYRFLKREKPQIVHSHTPKAGVLGMIAAKLAGVPIRLHTVAGLPLMEAEGFKRKILNAVEKLTYHFATKVYPNSKGLKEFILQSKFTVPEKLKLIAKGSSNGIDTEYFSPIQISEEHKIQLRKELGIQTTDFVFIFVGRLVKDKGINELVQAFKNLNKAHPHSKLLLVGPLEQELDPLQSQTLDEINSNSNIISVGFQKDVRPYFAISHVLAFPSYREGFPNVVLQAGAMGIPTIATDINGCNEIIQAEENGLIVPSKDVLALENSMRTMVSDKFLWNKMQKISRERIRINYENSVIWEALKREYNFFLNNID